MELLHKLLAMIPGGESALIAALATIIEVGLRLIPSPKPLSILRAVATVVDLGAQILVKIDGVLDKVIPQRLDQ